MPQQRCMRCTKPFDVEPPTFEIVNQVSFSAIVINHGTIQSKKCPECGTDHFIAIQGFNLAAVQMAFLPVPEQEEPSRIIMPN